ncbi:hypothetical protein, partial [Streptococcus gordonii]|uniref:hypothetical protein n=1 Tax=Streptococcus gordonii TaxID=1302 RepID=UPI0023B19F62
TKIDQEGKLIGDPTETAFIQYALDKGYDVKAMPNHSNQGTIDRKKGQRANQTSQSSRPNLPGFIELIAIAKGLNLTLSLTESSNNCRACGLYELSV